MTARAIDLNADAGELADEALDLALLSSVTSVNIACGVHAGSPERIARLSEAAAAHGVGAGAHPGLAEGRGPVRVTPEAAASAVRDQVDVFRKASAAVLQHVKLHGSLYHAARDPGVAEAVVAACRDRAVPILIAQAGSPLEAAARAAGLRVAAEAFLDRAYGRDGLLRPRGQPGALITDPRAIEERAVEAALRGTVRTEDGKEIRVAADTLCVHGDTPGAPALAAAARRALEDAGIEVRPLAGVPPPPGPAPRGATR